MQLHNFSDQILKSSEFDNLDNVDTETFQKVLIKIKTTILDIYNVKVHNLPEDFTANSYIIATNHNSDMNAPLVISYYYDIMSKVISYYPQLFVIAKKECFDIQKLMEAFHVDEKGAHIVLQIMDMEKISPIDRQSATGGINAILAAKRWFNTPPLPKHYLIFPQGTIYDINKEKAEDINEGVFGLADILQIPILPGYIEYAKEHELNRIVFGKPMNIVFDKDESKEEQIDNYRKAWLDEVINAQNSLALIDGVPAREQYFSEEHQIRKHFR